MRKYSFLSHKYFYSIWIFFFREGTKIHAQVDDSS